MNNFSASIQRTTTLKVCEGVRNPVVTSGGADSPSMKYKTPEEAGIARFAPPPKQDRRHQPKTKPFSRKWITRSEALAKGYKLP